MQTTRLCNEIQFFMTCIGFKGTAIPFEPKDIKSEFLKEQKLRQSCQIWKELLIVVIWKDYVNQKKSAVLNIENNIQILKGPTKN